MKTLKKCSEKYCFLRYFSEQCRETIMLAIFLIMQLNWMRFLPDLNKAVMETLYFCFLRYFSERCRETIMLAISLIMQSELNAIPSCSFFLKLFWYCFRVHSIVQQRHCVFGCIECSWSAACDYCIRLRYLWRRRSWQSSPSWTSFFFFIFFYYRSICIIDDGSSRGRTRNARFRARRTDQLALQHIDWDGTFIAIALESLIYIFSKQLFACGFFSQNVSKSRDRNFVIKAIG